MTQKDETTIRVAQAIRDLRRAQCITLACMSRRTGISPQHVHRHERGGRGLRLETVARYAEALNVSMSDLLRRAGL